MEWFPWYYERFRLKTRHLTAEQDGIYRRLIDEYMGTRQPLPDNDLALAGIARVTPECFSSASSTLRAFFKAKRGGILSNETCDELLAEQDGKSHFYSERAKKAALARHGKSKKINAVSASSKPEALLGDATITITETITDIKKTKEKKSDPIALFQDDLPDFIPRELWDGFVEMRIRIKKPMTPLARKLVIKELIKFNGVGYDVGFILSQSIKKNWQDVFEPKDGYGRKPAQKKQTVAERDGYEF